MYFKTCNKPVLDKPTVEPTVNEENVTSFTNYMHHMGGMSTGHQHI